MCDVEVTKHGTQRTKERVGLSKKLADKNAQKALEYGITHAEAKAGLKRYITRLYFNNRTANNIRVYNRYVYIFSGTCLITILNLPRKFYDIADQIQKKKRTEPVGGDVNC